MLFHINSGNKFFATLKQADADQQIRRNCGFIPIIAFPENKAADFSSTTLETRVKAWNEITTTPVLNCAVIDEVTPGLYKEVSSRHTAMLMNVLNHNLGGNISNLARKQVFIRIIKDYVPQIGNNTELELIYEELRNNKKYAFLHQQRHAWFDKLRSFIFPRNKLTDKWQTHSWQTIEAILKQQARSNIQNWHEIQTLHLEQWYGSLQHDAAFKIAYQAYKLAKMEYAQADARYDALVQVYVYHSPGRSGHYFMPRGELSKALDALRSAEKNLQTKRQELLQWKLTSAEQPLGDAKCANEASIIITEAQSANFLINNHRSNFKFFTQKWWFGNTKPTRTQNQVAATLANTAQKQFLECRIPKKQKKLK